MKLISVVLPFYNEKSNLPLIVDELKVVIDSLHSIYKFEVLLMDNHSTDGSDQLACDLKRKLPCIKVFRQSRNFGYQANILAGYAMSKGDAVVQLDADGEDDPNLIKVFLKEWEKGNQVVYGVRISRKEALFLTLQRKIFYRVLNGLSDIDIPIDAGDFRLVDRKLVNIICELKEANPYLRGLIAYLGFNQVGIPYSRRSRYSGVSKFSWFDYLRLSWDAITSFSRKPLSLIAMLGGGIFFLSIVFMAVYLGLYLAGYIVVRGFTTLVILQLVSTGLTLLSLGVVAIYLGRVFEEVKKRPVHVIEELI
jgi:dolichol-phosphate mannosyltransferase